MPAVDLLTFRISNFRIKHFFVWLSNSVRKVNNVQIPPCFDLNVCVWLQASWPVTADAELPGWTCGVSRPAPNHGLQLTQALVPLIVSRAETLRSKPPPQSQASLFVPQRCEAGVAAQGPWPGPASERLSLPPGCGKQQLPWQHHPLSEVSREWKCRQTLSLWKTSARHQRQLLSLGKSFATWAWLHVCYFFPGFDPAAFLTRLKLCTQRVVFATGSLCFLENSPVRLGLHYPGMGCRPEKLMC